MIATKDTEYLLDLAEKITAISDIFDCDLSEHTDLLCAIAKRIDEAEKVIRQQSSEIASLYKELMRRDAGSRPE